MRRLLRPQDRALRLAVGLVTALAATWALLTPLGTVPDEPAHVIYAGAVVRGQVGGGDSGRVVEVPADLAASSSATCPAFRALVTADCQLPLDGAEQTTAVDTSAARYPPLYYALVGWPTLLGFDAPAWYLARLASVAVCGLLLLVAASAWPVTGRPLAAGLLAASSPMVGFLAGSVNPNGPEIVAGVAVVLAGTGLVERLRRGEEPGIALPALGLAAAYLALARPASWGPLVGLLGVLALWGLPVLRRAARPVLARIAAVGAGAVVLGAITDVALPPAQPAQPFGPAVGLAGTLLRLTIRADDALYETAGMFGWRDHQLPLQLQALWLALPLALLVAALLVGSRTQRAALLLLSVAAVLLAPLFILLVVLPDGVGYQGRYVMPLTQAVPVLAAASLPAVSDRVTRVVPWFVLAVSALALGGSYLRYAVGLPYDPRTVLRDVEWVPGTWPLVLLALALAVLCAVRLQAVRPETVAASR